MNKLKKILILTLIAGFAYNGNAQGSVTASVAVSAEIIETITITNVVDMTFGDLTNDAGTVILTTANTITDPSSGTRGIGGTVASGGFTVGGGNNENFKLTISATDLVHGTDALKKMSISAIKVKQDALSDAAVGSGLSLTLTGTSDDFKIGASLTVGAAQLAGTYSGTMSVTVAYE
jgi:hypothetical protein